MCHWRYSDGRGAAAEWTRVVVYNCSQPLYHQLYRVSNYHRNDWNQPLCLHLPARCILQNIYSSSHRRRFGFDVDGWCCPRLTESPWLVVTPFRHQDSEVPMEPHCCPPLHHPLCRRRHAAAVCYHHHLLLAHLRSYSNCQAAHSHNSVTGKTRHKRYSKTFVHFANLHCTPDSLNRVRQL